MKLITKRLALLDEVEPIKKVKLMLTCGEILTIEENALGEVIITSTNDDSKMLLQPQAANSFLIRHISSERSK